MYDGGSERQYRITALTKGSDGRTYMSPTGYSLKVDHEMRHTHTHTHTHLWNKAQNKSMRHDALLPCY